VTGMAMLTTAMTIGGEEGGTMGAQARGLQVSGWVGEAMWDASAGGHRSNLQALVLVMWDPRGCLT
jgi:hypothetical protein